MGPPTIASFGATPSDAVSGHRVTLSWSVNGATRVSTSGIGAVAGAHGDVSPTTDTEYALTPTTSLGSAEARVQVTMYPAPNVFIVSIPTPVADGICAAKNANHRAR